ncbi:MAG: hypothetical protein M3068_02935 [Gemmatimonadota bacterium]|nr:hypothetical protein [Gemmatimonadota bacterium]
MPKRSSRPSGASTTDVNQIAARIIAQASTERPSQSRLRTVANNVQKNPAAVSLGRLGGKKGGKARAAKLSAERRSEIARNAAKQRWARVQRDPKNGS